ncbi:hypothetical protein [uncultured Aquimonas sp.]|nr:hypothetical protein [uncultured Aquimonas sp.]
MNLLRRLAGARLPCVEADPAMIDRLRVLEAAGQIEVRIPPASAGTDDGPRQDVATVTSITPRGWKTLAADAPPGEALSFTGTRRRSGE